MYSPVPQSPQLSLQLPAPLPSPYASPAYGRPTYPVGAPSIIGGGGSVTSAIGGSSSIVGGAFGGSVGGAALGPAGSASIAGGRIGTSGSVIGSQSILGGAGSSASVVSAGGLLSAANGGTVTSLNATNQQNTTIDNLVDTISNTSKILGRANYAVDHKDCYNLINNLERELQKRHFESKELNDELLRRQKRILELESLLGIKAHTSTTTSIGATHSQQHQQDIYGIGNASYGGVNSSFLGATHNALSSSQLSTTSSQYGSPPRYGNAGLSAHYSPTAVRYNVNDYDTAKRLDASDGVLDGTLKGSSISVQGQSLASGYGAQSSAYGAQSGGYSTQASGYGQSSVGYGPNSGYSNASTFVPSTPINNNTTISRPTTSVHYNTNDPQLARKLDASDGVLDGKLRGAEIQVRGQPYTTTTTTTGGASSSAWSTTPTTTTVTTGAPIKSTYYVNDPEMARKLDARDGVYDGKLSGSDIKVR